MSLVEEFRTAPVDAASLAALESRGLEYRTVDATDRDAASPWYRVVFRGFLGPEASEAQVEGSLVGDAYRRLTGVFDPGAVMPEQAVGTIASWIDGLSVPGGAVVPSAAISMVTVAPTHRRRGIARAMLEGELRVAAAAGAPLAMLTVTESPLYGRYGFGAAADSAAIRIDTARTTWTGPEPAGRVDFISREQWRELVPALYARVRADVPGEIDVKDRFWDRFAALRPGDKDGEAIRAVQYRDAEGGIQGAALYRVGEHESHLDRATATAISLVAATDDAYAALWRFLLDLDLVGTLVASERSTAEPVLWMIGDRRAATVTVTDHQYVRILDVAAALEARRYDTPGALVLEVEDPLGIADGVWTLDAAPDGTATATPGASAGAPRLALDIRELSALYLGGVSVSTLAHAGLVRSDDVAFATRMLGWHETPSLSIWY